MKQQAPAIAADQAFENYCKPTRRDEFLKTKGAVVPWAAPCEVVEPHHGLIQHSPNITPGAGKAVRKDEAFQIFAQGLVHVDPHAENDRPKPRSQAPTSLDKACGEPDPGWR